MHTLRPADVVADEGDRRGAATTAPGGSGTVLAALLVSQRCRRRDLAVAVLVLSAVAVVAFGSHVLHGSFYYDDWANSAKTHLAGGYGNALRTFWELTGYRPLLAWYVPTLHEVLGSNIGLHLAWATAAAVAMSAGLYALLTEVGMARLHAVTISALVLVFPFSDATRFWATSATAHLTAALWMAGLVVALRAFDAGRTRRSARRLHALSVCLYLASLLLYELPATLMLGGGALYLLRAGWRRGLTRWAVDVAVIAPTLAYILTTSTIDTAPGGAGRVEHARLILDQGWRIMASAAWPFATVSRGVVTVVAGLVLAVSAGLLRRLARGDPLRAVLARWLVFASGGFVATWTAWAVFVPGHPYYSPGTQGVGNRVNVLAAIGIVVLLYSLIVIAVAVVGRALGLGGSVAPLVAWAAALVVGASYLAHVRTDARAWDAAARAQERTLAVLEAKLPAPEPGSVIWTFGGALWQGPGIPIFASSWDLNGAVQLAYDDPTLRGYPAQPLTKFACGPDEISPVNAAGSPPSPYGKAYFVDVVSGQVDRLTDPEDCRAAAARFKPGPYELPEVSP